jgi:hypothetical protein
MGIGGTRRKNLVLLKFAGDCSRDWCGFDSFLRVGEVVVFFIGHFVADLVLIMDQEKS